MMRRLWIFVAGLILTAGGMAAQPSEPQVPVATSHVAGTMLVVTPQVAHTSSTLRVTGPEGYEVATGSDGGDLVLDLLAAGRTAAFGNEVEGTPQALPDGRYGYEVVLFLADGGSRMHDGNFYVDRGVVLAPSAESRADSVAGLSTQAVAVDSHDDAVVIWDNVGDGQTRVGVYSSAAPTTEDPGQAWFVSNDSGDFRLISGLPQFNNETKPFTVETNGNVGIGTTQPGTDLHIFNTGFSSRIRLAAGASGQNELVNWSDGLFEIAGNAGRPVRIFPSTPDNSLVLRPAGVGIGTVNPGTDLHIFNSGVSSRIRLAAGASGQNELVNWSDGLFEIAGNAGRTVRIFPSTPDNSLVLLPAGVGIGTASPTAKLHVAGTFRVDGDVALHSSRTVKTGFDPVSPAEILAGLADLPVASWRYKTEEESKRHIGPFAEDFQRLFGLGDGETISVIDAQGVAFAAIKALQQESVEKDAKVAERDARIADLTERLSALEETLATLTAE